jgi:hypothetical protein
LAGGVLALTNSGSRPPQLSLGWIVSPTLRCRAWEMVGADLVSPEETLPRGG